MHDGHSLASHAWRCERRQLAAACTVRLRTPGVASSGSKAVVSTVRLRTHGIESSGSKSDDCVNAAHAADGTVWLASAHAVLLLTPRRCSTACSRCTCVNVAHDANGVQRSLELIHVLLLLELPVVQHSLRLMLVSLLLTLPAMQHGFRVDARVAAAHAADSAAWVAAVYTLLLLALRTGAAQLAVGARGRSCPRYRWCSMACAQCTRHRCSRCRQCSVA